MNLALPSRNETQGVFNCRVTNIDLHHTATKDALWSLPWSWIKLKTYFVSWRSRLRYLTTPFRPRNPNKVFGLALHLYQ
jgi:hypothetical protein